MRFIDFFSGIGGFRLGMEMAGHECVGHCEIDKFANKSYVAMHKPRKGEWYASDIRRVNPGDLPEAEVYCFGFPCQAFSIAGKRGGFSDTRGTLFFEVMRLAKERKPDILFAENVKGLLSHDSGRTFGTIIRNMAELGYDVEWQVLDSQNFGVPQHRERVYIIGHLRGRGGQKIFPFGSDRKKTDELQRQVSGTITTRSGESAAVGTYVVENKQHAQNIKCININDDNGKERSQQEIYSAEGIMTALSSQLGGRHNIAINKYTDTDPEIRRLTPKECFRLQGFPDEYFERAAAVNSDRQLYKQAGNSVTVNVIYEIARRLC